ncbi:MAG: VOC family protein [Deltaproteobacteria bacterium]|nr:VOC family protein [Deltaproteobacteria bacterium]MBW2413892.1 VOC family protein [Deltaproteobacteria bacterium]
MPVLFDHIAIAAPRINSAPDFLVGVLGGASGFGGPAGEYAFWHWDYPAGGRIEVIEPSKGDDGKPQGFVHRHLESRGPGIHHVTFKVPSLAEVCDRARSLGYEIVGFDDRNAHWQEAFLHPKQALGIVVQMVESQPREDGGEYRGANPPPEPDSPPAPVTVVGLRMRSGDRERTLRQWAEVLQGQPEEDAGEIVFHWPGCSMRVAVTLEGHSNLAEAIELRADRPLALPEGPHPVLGTEFRQLD